MKVPRQLHDLRPPGVRARHAAAPRCVASVPDIVKRVSSAQGTRRDELGPADFELVRGPEVRAPSRLLAMASTRGG